MSQALNLILITSPELSKLRDLLKGSLVNREGKELFVALYASWCHSPMAIISLCLLAQVNTETKKMIVYFLEDDHQILKISKLKAGLPARECRDSIIGRRRHKRQISCAAR